MRNLARAVQLLVLLLLTSASSIGHQSSAQGSVEGQITLAGKPISGVTVILTTKSGPQSETLASSVTDEAGHFKLDGVPPGSYAVDAFAPAFVAAGASLSNLARGKGVMVGKGEAVTGVEIALTRGGIITGRVVDSNQRPVIDLPVDLRQLDQSGRRLPRRVTASDSDQFMYRTDDRGVYRIYGLPGGRYKVSVGVPAGAGAITHRGGYYPLSFYPDTTDESKAQIIELGEGNEVGNVDISISSFARTYDVSGEIVDAESGQSLAGLLCGYGAVSDSGQYVGTVAAIRARSSRKGEFYIAGLTPGRYAAFAINEGESQFYCEPTVFEVTNSDVNGIQIRMKHGASISGIIAFEGIDEPATIGNMTTLKVNVAITPYALEPFRRDPVQIAPDGRFSVTGLRPGKALISVRGSLGGKNVILSRIEHDGMEQQAFELRAGEQLRSVRLVLSF